MGFGDGSLVHQNSIRCTLSRTASSFWVKTTTAHFCSFRKVEYDDSLTEKSNLIHSQGMWSSSGPEGFFAIAMVVCGSEPLTGASCMYIRTGRIDSRPRTVYQPITFTLSLRIVTALSGFLLLTAVTVSATLPSLC